MSSETVLPESSVEAPPRLSSLAWELGSSSGGC